MNQFSGSIQLRECIQFHLLSTQCIDFSCEGFKTFCTHNSYDSSLGAVLLTPFVGYTTYREFVTYTKVDGEWHANLPMAATLILTSPTWHTICTCRRFKAARYQPSKRQTRPSISILMLCLHQRVISIAGYDKYIENIN